MLYDPKWQTKTDPFTLESFISWLETMPAHEAYDYMNCEGECLFGQYVVANGLSWESVKEAQIYTLRNTARQFKKFLYEKVAGPAPWTFGAALKRAKAARS